MLLLPWNLLLSPPLWVPHIFWLRHLQVFSCVVFFCSQFGHSGKIHPLARSPRSLDRHHPDIVKASMCFFWYLWSLGDFLKCFSCCITGQLRTLAGKRWLPSFCIHELTDALSVTESRLSRWHGVALSATVTWTENFCVTWQSNNSKLMAQMSPQSSKRVLQVCGLLFLQLFHVWKTWRHLAWFHLVPLYMSSGCLLRHLNLKKIIIIIKRQ